MALIKEKHKEIFDFLMEKHRQNPELRVLLRATDEGNKLNDGHWFYGYKEEYLNISFWNAWENDSPTLNIAFRIHNNGDSEIILSGKSAQKADILDKVANSFASFEVI